MATGNTARSTVLIVDDEGLIRWSLAEVLADEGFRVFEAGDARHALEYFRGSDDREGFCVVLLDLKLPDSSDLGLLRKIRELAPRCRIILMTAYGTPEIIQEAREAGAFRVIGKPFDIHAMMENVHAAIGPTSC